MPEVIEDKNKENSNVKKRGKGLTGRRKVKPVLVVLILLVFIIVGSTYTWYLFTKDNQGDRKDVEIMTPYFLYLLNPDDVTSLQFSVGNLHPGETKQIVICVSNKKPIDVEDTSIDIARNSKFNYDLEFIYTENLLVNYDIYELQKYELEENQNIEDDFIFVKDIDNVYWKKSEGRYTSSIDDEGNEIKTPLPLTVTKDVTEERLNSVFGADTYMGDMVNKGKYLLYQEDGQTVPQPMGLEYKDGEYEFDYYLIEMSWKDGVNFTDYTKETDLIYVVVNAKQPKPKEQSND